MSKSTTIDTLELAKFAQLAQKWWDSDGPLKTLHDINPVRICYVKQHVNLNSA